MKNKLLAPELRELLKNKKIDELRSFCESVHPANVAEFLSALEPFEILETLKYLDHNLRAEVFGYLDEDSQVELANSLSRTDAIQLLTDMAPDERADLFKHLPDDKKESILPGLAHAEREDIRRLTAYEERTAGAVMTSDYATLSPDITISEAIVKLRKEAPDKETIYYAYVIDDHRKLLGLISLKDLILSPPDIKVDRIMELDVIFARVEDDQEDVARKIQKYDLLAIPVVDQQDALVGIITHDDAIDIITQEQTEDMEKFMAIAGSHERETYLKTPSLVHFKNRSYWIIGLAAVGLVSGVIIHSFEATLMQLLVLALYMPMVADTGGNTGSQSATVVVRALALKEIAPKDILKVLFKEFKISILLSIVLGVMAWAKVMFLSRNTDIPASFNLSKIGLAIAIALSLQVITSTVIGAILPISAAKLKLDPAVVASPALTTIVDITGLLIYFSMAKFILGI